MALTPAQRRWLADLLADRVVFDEPMSRHTYMRVGGPADALAAPVTLAQLKALVAWAADQGLPWMAVGDGTNLLVHDDGIRALVIVLHRCADTVSVRRIGKDKAEVQVGAGVRLQRLCRLAVDQGLAGLTFATGIPGTLGGALRMNAGTRLGCMRDVVRRIGVIDAGGKHHCLQGPELDFGYRRLNLPSTATGGSWLITQGWLHLYPTDRQLLGQRDRHLLERRRLSQPVDAASAGCFFKNPPSGPRAGRLIDLAGFKGVSVGDAMVSRQHANFIVNRGRANASDVWALAQQIRDRVRDQFHVELEPEVHLVGFPKNT